VIADIQLTVEKLNSEALDYENLSTDVIVRMDTGERYIATFFSYKNLVETVKLEMETWDPYQGQYYKVLDTVIVKDFNSGDLRAVIEHMVAEGDFQLVFKKM
jgi:hypothetical protein